MQVITSTQALEAFCKDAAGYDFVTVDTEFLRETTYWPKLCLIQAATPERAVIIDPLGNGIDLAPFADLLADHHVTKVFHAARQDIEIFVKLFGAVPQPLFDTQVAASVCGHGDSISYDNLVRSIVGEQIDKSSRFTDWSHRPLSDKQLTYALADVTHLRNIYVQLREEIAKARRQSWVADEMAILENVGTYVVEPEDAWKRVKARVTKPRDLAALQALAAWREQRAQQNDQPRGRILKDDALAELATQRPTKSDAFEKLRAVPRGFGRSGAAAEIIEVIQKVEAIDKSALPKAPERPRGASPKGAIGDLLRVWLRAVADANGVATRIIASSDDIDAIVLDDNADVPALKGWRRKLFGDKALAIKHGRLALAATSKGVVEVPVDAN
ncbi:ribonuclease D [Pelagibacterium lacus]|uniref:Ribonuclease D n=1 Tax=Pelagibacterium lacus TaxID=2282655 RepID=A0A369WCI9_9HYPH|nr:ribonuclease D [Pelagibacterium lacus]RDE09831.1 ribonuclease D [Pelagibacterium lacus]